ncbi:tetratricopeptide repeat protein 16-like [Poeciliopsis prolifica]|uniref:tetratricopeptide repeat protein 16-like n=1 Tax=Poeciliopsis prolifica TaxID=188132 RepID=UPI0024135668|nr:tetratricopeptide repeat protein 16-like [Poeciliopsis prolifica]
MDDDQTYDDGESVFPPEVKLERARRRSTYVDFSDRLVAVRDYRFLKPKLNPDKIIKGKAAEHFRRGKWAMERFQYEEAVLCFTKAIYLQPKQIELYVSLGDAFIQLCDFQSAADSYNQASFLEPGAFNARLAFIYYMQAQCLFDRGLFQEALDVFGKAAELKPEAAYAFRIRSLACLAAAGRHSDCLKELDLIIAEGPTAELHVFRARVYKTMNQTTRCIQDVRSALKLDPGCREARAMQQHLMEACEENRQQAVIRMLSGQLQEALCLINAALESNPENGQLYLFRGILYRRLKEFISAIEDLVLAAELCEPKEEERKESSPELKEVQLQLALTYNDFAVQCFSRGLYDEALLLLNKAIKEDKNLGGLYLNRGDCFFRQADWCYALLDYQQAEEMLSPNEPALRLRLAIIHSTLGSFCFQDWYFQDAADMFSLAITYNPTTSQYYEYRSKALRRIQDLRGAREDLIRLLILDPDNEEIPPMMMNLFPGSTVTQVLSSTKGQSLRDELEETIRVWDSSSDPEKSLEESLTGLSLSSEDPEGEALSLSEAAQELRLCVSRKDLQNAAKALLQVDEAVESFIPVCPVLRQSSNSASQCPPTASASTLPLPENLSCLGFEK